MGCAYHDLDDSAFERLVVQIMRKLFGPGVQNFGPGKDGGRDALFDGVANLFPSQAGPWKGKTVGQAKLTITLNAHFSDADFSGNGASSVLSKEKLRVKKLVDADEIDNYFLLTNRRLGGIVGPKVTKDFAESTGLPRDRVFLAGIEYLDDQLHAHPDLMTLAKIDPLDLPLRVSSWDLAEVILAIADELDAAIPESDAPVVDRVSYDAKNALNNMTPEFAAMLSDDYLADADEIKAFLGDPQNLDSLKRYEGAVEDFKYKITAKRSEFQTFDNVFNHLYESLIQADPVLRKQRKLLRSVLFYMYWNCDIGKVASDATT